MSQLVRLTESNFEEEVIKSGVPVLVEFSGSWCVPSQQMKPLLKLLAGSYDGRVKVGLLNVDQSPRVALRYNIMGCPTFILFKQGMRVSRKVGAQSKKQLEEMLV